MTRCRELENDPELEVPAIMVYYAPINPHGDQTDASNYRGAEMLAATGIKSRERYTVFLSTTWKPSADLMRALLDGERHNAGK